MRKKSILAFFIIFIMTATILVSTSIVRSPVSASSPSAVQPSQPPTTAWTQHYGSASTDEAAYSMVQTSDGGYVLAGSLYSYHDPPADFPNGYWGLLVKVDSSGNMQWNKTYGGNKVAIGGFYPHNYLESVVQTSDGGYALAGYTDGYSGANFQIWLIKTDSAGNPSWSYLFDPTPGSNSYAYSLLRTSDGYLIAGGGTLGGSSGALLIKTDSAGKWSWWKCYGGASGGDALSVIQTSDGGYALAGGAVVKTDSAGNLQWIQPLPTDAVNACSIIQTSDGGYAYTGDWGEYNQATYLAKTDSNGVLQWNRTGLGAGGVYNKFAFASSIVQTPDGGYAQAGTTSGFGHGGYDFIVWKTDSAGDADWWNCYGDYYDDKAYCMNLTSDGGLAITGSSKSYTNGGTDMWLVKLSALTPGYSTTIWSWDATDPHGWIVEPITVDGTDSGYSTPHTFLGMEGTHTITVPSTDVDGAPFGCWDTGEKTTTLTVTSAGTHTAQYGISPVFLVVRGENNQICYRRYLPTSGIWSSWVGLPGATFDSPAAAVCGNELHIVVRGVNNGAIWHGYVDLTTNSFSGWEQLSGSTPSAPTLTSNSTHLCLVVRGNNNAICYRFYTLATRTWTDWSTVPGGSTIDTPGATICGAVLYITVRGSNYNQIWYGLIDLDSATFHGWNQMDGATPSPPTLTSNPANVCLLVRGSNNVIYYRWYDPFTKLWSPSWSSCAYGTTPNAPAGTMTGDSLQIAVRGTNYDQIWCSNLTVSTLIWSGWTPVDGATPSAPTLTS